MVQLYKKVNLACENARPSVPAVAGVAAAVGVTTVGVAAELLSLLLVLAAWAHHGFEEDEEDTSVAWKREGEKRKRFDFAASREPNLL